MGLHGKEVSEGELTQLFSYCTKGREVMAYRDFERYFQWKVPQGTIWETSVISKIRDWMYKNGMNSETVFESFCKKTNKVL